MLVESILEGVCNDTVISSNIFIPSPLRDLILQYNKIALNKPELPVINELTTGKELKEAIVLLDPKDQVRLLHNYSLATKDLNHPLTYSHDPRTAEEKRMHMLMLKVGMGIMVLVVCLLVGALISVAVMSGAITDTSFAKALVSTAAEILKFILSTGGK